MPTPHHDLLASGPAAGFDDPVGMLYACHGRIRRQLDTLRRLAGHLATHGADHEAQRAAAAVLRYFDTAGPHHHADEEEGLFPLVRTWAARCPDAPGAARAVQTMDRLEQGHRDMDAAWQRLRPWLEAIRDGNGAALPAAALNDWHSLYAAHLPMEEEDVFALAAACLSPAQLAGLSRAMAERRGVPWPPPGGLAV
jgi:iron-sulfur cluster repair protein YtfE (RIC family)